MAEGIAISATMGLAQMVAARALDEINLAWGFKDQLLELNKKLEYVQAFLEDAGNSKHAQKSRLVNLWLKKIKDVAYLADDILDEFAIENFRRKMELKHGFKKRFRNFFTPLNPVFFRFQMAHKVKGVLSLFDEIAKDAKDIGLNQVDIAATAVTDTYNYDGHLGETRRHAGANASEFVGREHDQAKLLDAMCIPNNEECDLSTMAIVGMGGLGKTTLARRLYDHERISALFGKNKIWICVSQRFEITKILNEMVESVTKITSALSNTDAIIRKLQEELKGNKLLVVFDDVWNDNKDSWGSLIGLLLKIGTAPGSVILITTRSDEVTKAARVVFKHRLNGLSEPESFSLLHKILSNKSTPPKFSGMEEVGRRIVEKCNGVPLAIKVIGGLLQSKHQLCEWESIEKSGLWDVAHGQNQIPPSLLLSFNHLPSPSVKQCFAYYAIFSKGFFQHKNELIGLWLSQGYLRDDKKNNLTFEEIGENNLKILVSNSLLEEFVPRGREIVCYKMHDLVYDLAHYVCGSDLIKEAKDLHMEGGCLHLDFKTEDYKTVSYFPPQEALMKLRTIRFRRGVQWDMLTHTRYLRSLYIDRSGITKIPETIVLLKHLRYLDVSYNPIRTLPDTFGKLYQLQTLILQGCRNMKKLPKVLNKLMNLRYISTTVPMFAFKGLQNLTNLRSLPCLSLDDCEEGWSIDELGNLNELRGYIHIQGLEFVKDKEQARNAGLGRKAKVTDLKLSWVNGRRRGIVDEDVLEGLEPHPNITSLEVQNFRGEKLPTWIMGMVVKRTQLNNLTMVKLLNCSGCQTLPTLGQLLFLKCLILSGLNVEVIGIEFYGGDDLHMQTLVSFECLQKFEMRDCHNLTTWIEPPKEAFPHLETLLISKCRLLKSVPAFKFKSLTSLRLEYLNSLNSVSAVNFVMDDLRHARSTLRAFEIIDCPGLSKIPSSLEECSSLETLVIVRCPKIIASPRHISKLRSLSQLRINYHSVEHMRSVVEAAKDLPLLRRLEIERFTNDKEMSDYFSDTTPFLRLPSLSQHMLDGSMGSLRFSK